MKSSEIIDAFHFRHACKVFNAEKKISDNDFMTILETGRLSPSSFGFEPWKFLVVQNSELREKLKPVTWGAQGTLPTASHFVVILARKQKSMRYDSDYITHMMYDVHKIPEEQAEQRRSFYQTFQEKDFKLFESERAMFDWAGKQTYIALGNMMTAAAMLGIDSCPIEGFKADEVEKLMAEEFEVDTEEFGVAVMVAFGYRVNEQPEKTRQSMEDITQWYR
ncbi:NAD(P)H-dependent oxidoreductase [Sulfurovum riftiae]|uniref:NAD(P)H-dependent oxidoreductase n=1 Tax=Sulfurovum riftiae TaxID=1630136 RepID=A0A151CIJ9_9BACT|nr:NAD(P)H-dependent oxidoreductase [Sulfurovum riftiae]KYJ87319.1 NAD(P)H-dependent oxidoreductase [Sulfurovum riftiae]